MFQLMISPEHFPTRSLCLCPLGQKSISENFRSNHISRLNMSEGLPWLSYLKDSFQLRDATSFYPKGFVLWPPASHSPFSTSQVFQFRSGYTFNVYLYLPIQIWLWSVLWKELPYIFSKMTHRTDLTPLWRGQHHLSVPSKTVTNHCWKINAFYDVTALWLRSA